MRKRLRIVTAFVVVAAIGGLAWWALTPREPVYQGKRLSEWLREASGYGQREEYSRQEIEMAVKAIGTNALPRLIEMMQREDSPFRLTLINLAGRQQFMKVHLVEAAEIRTEGAVGCRILGPAAKPALPQLEQLFSSDHGNGAAAFALARIGPEGVKFLIDELTNKTYDLRSAAAFGLAGIRPDQEDKKNQFNAASDWTEEADMAIPPLVTILTNKGDLARRQAAFTLGYFHRQAGTVVPALISVVEESAKTLGHNDWFTEHSAIEALGDFGPDASNAIPVLTEIKGDASSAFQGYAEKALKQIDPEAAAKAGVK